eukprot:GCRY01001949.1.p1 GENE.GCRY01001949.1~~GCRY01001949.1.p1  ORF type:complete len:917 (-),score=299.17 GCRY01001949.1:858-3608(-)
MSLSSMLVAPSEFCNRKLRLFFKASGCYVASHPHFFIFLSFVLFVGCGVGVLFLEQAENNLKIWNVPSSDYNTNSEWYEDTYPDASVYNTLLSLSLEEDGNTLSLDILQELKDLVNKIYLVSITDDGKTYDLQSLCVASCVLSLPHVIEEAAGVPLNYLNDTTLLAVVNQLSKIPTIPLTYMLGDISYANGQIIGAKAVLTTWFITAESDRLSTVIEYADAFSDAVNDYPATKSRLIPFPSHLDGETAKMIVAAFPFLGISVFVMCLYLCYIFYHKRRVESQISLAFLGLVQVILAIVMGTGLSGYFQVPYTSASPLVAFLCLGICIDGVFIIVGAFSLTNPHHTVERRAGDCMEEAGVSLFISHLTSLAAFALGTFSNFPAVSYFCELCVFCIFSDLFLECTLFLAFVSLNAKHQEKGEKCCCGGCVDEAYLAEKASKTRSRSRTNSQSFAGPAAQGSLTEVTTTHHPNKATALETKGGRDDLVLEEVASKDIPAKVMTESSLSEVSFHVNEETEKPQQDAANSLPPTPPALPHSQKHRLRYVFADHYMRVLHNKPFQILVILLLLGYVGLSSFMYSNIEMGTSMEDMVLKDSFVLDYVDYSNKYWDTGITYGLSMYTYGWVDLGDPTVQTRMLEIQNKLNNNLEGKVQAMTFWLPYYIQWANSHGYPVSGPSFLDHLNEFLAVDSFSSFTQDILINSTGQVYSTRMTGQLLYEDSGWANIDLYHDILDIAEASEDVMRPYCRAFMWVDSFEYYIKEVLQNSITSCSAIVVILLLAQHPFCAICTFVLIIMVILDMLGAMALIGYTLNAISVAGTVLAIGISLDYCVHFASNFVVTPGKSLQMRVYNTMAAVGPPIYNAAFTTFLSVLLLAFTPADLFIQFFFVIFFVVFFGLIHALVVLPIVFLYFGPESHVED